MKLPQSFGRLKRRKLFYVRRVHGNSMLPVLRPRSIVLASARYNNINCGDVVIVRHNGLEKIKRVTQATATSVYVQGDNAVASTDSRHFGWLSKDLVIAKVIWPCVT